jgi:hypothetical protein
MTKILTQWGLKLFTAVFPLTRYWKIQVFFLVLYPTTVERKILQKGQYASESPNVILVCYVNNLIPISLCFLLEKKIVDV